MRFSLLFQNSSSLIGTACRFLKVARVLLSKAADGGRAENRKRLSVIDPEKRKSSIQTRPTTPGIRTCIAIIYWWSSFLPRDTEWIWIWIWLEKNTESCYRPYIRNKCPIWGPPIPILQGPDPIIAGTEPITRQIIVTYRTLWKHLPTKYLLVSKDYGLDRKWYVRNLYIIMHE